MISLIMGSSRTFLLGSVMMLVREDCGGHEQLVEVNDGWSRSLAFSFSCSRLRNSLVSGTSRASVVDRPSVSDRAAAETGIQSFA